MNNLIPIKFKNQNVITTELLAEVYGTDVKNIQMNFKRNEKNFEEDKHYYFLQGEELKQFKSLSTESGLPVNKFASSLYLWTERGANRHCKILDTDKAWEQFDNLEETYFRVKENPYMNLSKELQAIFMMDKKHQELEKGQEVLTEKVTNLENKMTINYELAENIRSEISAKAVHSLGGYNSPAYKKLSKKAYSALHRDLKGYFKVNSYKNLSVKRYEEAINYIQGWTPGTNLMLEIKEMNNQIEFKMVN
ncbi:ORF6C domain-containing protein [Clostridioides mangenotii]|uniref:ORF6C domain-containing protein n=1 Tax=Metaclostridioides mangenotii TaxID=1540 RepID=UPI001C113DBD|nr:ORF6C domain-containing protein [Clostridioides mangenotii]MBU5308429.1 ORF6C domain-containing protein [Clostridioides mangenotii]